MWYLNGYPDHFNRKIFDCLKWNSVGKFGGPYHLKWHLPGKVRHIKHKTSNCKWKNWVSNWLTRARRWSDLGPLKMPMSQQELWFIKLKNSSPKRASGSHVGLCSFRYWSSDHLVSLRSYQQLCSFQPLYEGRLTFTWKFYRNGKIGSKMRSNCYSSGRCYSSAQVHSWKCHTMRLSKLQK